MSELNEGNRINLDVLNNPQSYDYLPSYMRSANSLLQVREKISKLSWEVEGEQVRIKSLEL
jgi:hypothetical protein